MVKKLIIAAILLTLCISVFAQHLTAYKGSLVYTLGPDTTAVGNFELNGSNFKLTVVAMSPNVNVSKLTGTFFPDGQLKYIEGNNYDPAKGKDSLLYSFQLNYDRDTTFIQTTRGSKNTVRKYPVKIMEVNAFGGDVLVFMPALLANYAPKRIGDSIVSNHIAFNSARKFVIKKTGNNKLLLGSAVMGRFTLYLDKNGRLQSVDGIGTSFNIKGTAGPFLNIDSVVTANLKHQQSNPRLAVINKLDSTEATINTVAVKVIYSRPSVRGRVIFGEVVPWNRVWRTGADAATKITLSKPLHFNGKELPAGAYSFFTIPTPTGWTLIFNKQADIWGTEHNADFDFLKLPMVTQHLNETAELLTFAVVADGNKGGIISVCWDKLKASVSFTTEP